MNRWIPPETKSPSVPRAPTADPAGTLAALEMQLRALREALDRAVRVGENATYEAKALREELLCERLRHNELKTRFKELQRFHNATTVGEVEMVQTENRRLRTALAEASLERNKLIEALRVHAPSVHVPVVVPEEQAEITFESPDPPPAKGRVHR